MEAGFEYPESDELRTQDSRYSVIRIGDEIAQILQDAGIEVLHDTEPNDEEIRDCIVSLMTTDAGTGFMHESFSRHDAADYTRAWFAWQNTLFGELILKLVNEGKADLLNSIR